MGFCFSQLRQGCLSTWATASVLGFYVHFLRCFIHSHKTPVVLFSGLWLIQALLCWSFAIITGVCVLIGLGLWLSRRPWQDGTELWRFTAGILKRAGQSLAMLVIPVWCCMDWFIRCQQGQMPCISAVYRFSQAIFHGTIPEQWFCPQ